MTSEVGSNSDSPGAKDPYSLLGLEPGASFDAVQEAREKRLDEVGADPQARAKIEASYDALLMTSLRERQLGKVSSAAANASKREKLNKQFAGKVLGSNSLLTTLRGKNTSDSGESTKRLLPDLTLSEGQGLAIRLSLGVLALVLLLLSPAGGTELILSIGTIALFISQIKRGRKPLASLGWSIALLSVGLVCGGLLIKGVSPDSLLHLPLTSDQLEALPALLLIWAGTLLIA